MFFLSKTQQNKGKHNLGLNLLKKRLNKTYLDV